MRRGLPGGYELVREAVEGSELSRTRRLLRTKAQALCERFGFGRRPSG